MRAEYRNTDYVSIGNPIVGALKLTAMETLADRVRWARHEKKKWTQKDLSKKAKISQSVLSDVETGEIKETGAIVRIALACGVSAYWLETGKGPRELSEYEAAIVDLDESDMRVVMDMIKALRARRAA
jgi:transcriptional regulator with XRE-family HTH domain